MYYCSESFYYKYYPATKEESFCFVENYSDSRIIERNLYVNKAKRYPLGFLLSKCFRFFEELRIEPLEMMRNYKNQSQEDLTEPEETIEIKYLNDVRQRIFEYESNLSYDDFSTEKMLVDENGNKYRQKIFYSDRRQRIFKKVFSSIKDDKFNLAELNDSVNVFAYFMLKAIYDIESSDTGEMMISLNIIFDFIERSITDDYKYCTYENLCITVTNNRDKLDNGYTSFGDVWSDECEYNELKNVYISDKFQLKDKEVYHYYKVETLKDFLYATLQEILKNNHVIKRCNNCNNIFVPLKSKSNKYCIYKLYEGSKKNCYQLHNTGTIVYKEKHNACETERKQIRSKLNKWVNYSYDDIEFEKRKAIRTDIYKFIQKLKRVITDENEFLECLKLIHKWKLKTDDEYNKLKDYLNDILSKHENQ